MNVQKSILRIFLYWMPQENISDFRDSQNTHRVFLEPWVLTLLDEYKKAGSVIYKSKQIVPIFFLKNHAEDKISKTHAADSDSESLELFAQDIKSVSADQKEFWIFTDQVFAIELASILQKDMQIVWYGTGNQPANGSQLVDIIPNGHSFAGDEHDDLSLACPSIKSFFGFSSQQCN